MSKSIRSYPANEKINVVERRLKNKTLGLGYWSAVDFYPALTRKSVDKKNDSTGEVS